MDMEEARLTLERVGFDDKETRVYLALLRLSESSATAIARESGVERTLVYHILDKLLDRGMVSHKLRRNVRVYSASSPSRILADMDERRKAFTKALPFLEALHATPSPEAMQVQVFTGLEGLKTVVDDMVTYGTTFRVLGEEGQLQKHHPSLYKQSMRRVREQGIIEKVIVREDMRGKVWKSRNTEFRYIPKDMVSPANTVIYADRVLITLWGHPTHCILITSESAAQSYTSYFRYMWRHAKK